MHRVFGSQQCVSAGVRCEAESPRALHRLREAIYAARLLHSLQPETPSSLQAVGGETVKDVSIFPPGTDVDLRGTDISGIVRDITIYANGLVSYTVTWWTGGECKSACFPESEVSSKQEPVRIGFK
jgi:hypothetical protein